jgi:dTDP-4-dehydrorhamnose 3,5-epimerase
MFKRGYGIIFRVRLPAGVRIVPLAPHGDDRGVLVEVFRAEWATGIKPVQWNAVRSEPGVLRGVHVHPVHDDYLVLVVGRATIGLRDLRRGSPTEGLVSKIPMSAAEPTALVVPHGVAHGFLFHEPSIHIYAVTHYWNPADELACRWDDSELGIAWPAKPTLLAERDAAAGTFRQLVDALGPFQPIGGADWP